MKKQKQNVLKRLWNNLVMKIYNNMDKRVTNSEEDWGVGDKSASKEMRRN